MAAAFYAAAACLILVAHIVVRLLQRSPIPRTKSRYFGLENIGNYYADPATFIRNAGAKYGPVFEVNMLFSKTIWLRSVQLNREYLETREDVWSFGDGMGKFLNQIVRPDYWKNLKTFVGSLSRGTNRADTLQYYQSLTFSETAKAVDNWQTRDSVEIFTAVSHLMHGALVRCLMGEDFHEHHVDELLELLHEMEANLGSVWNFLLPHWVPHPAARRLWAARDRMHAIFQERMQARALNPQRWERSGDYVSYTSKDPATKSLEHLFGDHHTIIQFAAHTSAVSLVAWALIELLRSPVHLAALRKSLGECANPMESSYLDAVLKETIRHYSSIADLRLARKPKRIEIKIPTQSQILPDTKDTQASMTSFVVPPGRLVSISPYLTHHDPALFPRPETWTPERWVEDPLLYKRLNEDDRIGFFPFGSGSHRCPGEKMTWMMAATMVSAIVQDYDLDFKGDSTNVTSDLLDFSKIGSPWLKGGMEVTVRKRSQR